MSPESKREPAGGCIPDSYSLIGAGQGEELAVRAENHIAHRVHVGLERENGLPCRRVPDLHGVILPRRGDALAIGAASDADDGIGVPLVAGPILMTQPPQAIPLEAAQLAAAKALGPQSVEQPHGARRLAFLPGTLGQVYLSEIELPAHPLGFLVTLVAPGIIHPGRGQGFGLFLLGPAHALGQLGVLCLCLPSLGLRQDRLFLRMAGLGLCFVRLLLGLPRLAWASVSCSSARRASAWAALMRLIACIAQ